MSFLDDLLPEEEKKVADGPVLDFTASRKTLERVLSEAGSVIQNKGLIPVLSNIQISVSGLELKAVGSDSVLSAITRADALLVAKEGSAVFPAARFSALVREADSDEFHIRVVSKKSNKIATLKCGKASWTLPLMSGEDFPDLFENENFGLVEVDRLPFLSALQRVRKAISSDPMRPYLTLVDVVNGKMRASDSIRFQQVKYEFPFDCQIPARAVSELVTRLSSSNLENIEVGQTNNALLFRFGGTLLIAQKVVAKFPDVDEVLLKPTLSNDQILKVDRQDLLKAIRRVRILADETTSAVVLSLNEGSVSVEAKDRKGGTAAIESVPAEWNYSPRHVYFNHQHLSDMLASTSSEKCVFRLGKDLKTRPTPLLMEDSDEGFTAVLSQIRLDWLN